MDSQDAGNLDLHQDSEDTVSRHPVSAAMSRDHEGNQETPAAHGKLLCEAMVIEPQTGDTEADIIKGPDTSTPKKTLMPSNTNTPVLAPLQQQQQTNVNYDLTGATFNFIQDSRISDSQLHLGGTSTNVISSGPQDPVESNQEVESPNHCSLLFSKACLRCAKCLDEEDRLDELKLMLQCWSPNDTTEKLFPDAQAAKSVVQLFLKAMQRNLWHWLDFDNLIHLLDPVDSKKAKGILNEYEKHLMQFCEKELHTLLPYRESQTPPTATTWMDVKWNGEKERFKLGNLYKCKKFLVNHLGIPSSDFVFSEVFPGCVTLRWVVLTKSACAVIEAKSCTGCIRFLDADMEIKLIRPLVKPVKQNVTYSSDLEEISNTGENLFFGNTEYVFTQLVPQYAQCPICLGILQNAVVTNCCQSAFCLECCEKARQASSRCPICRREDFQHARTEFIDKQVVGNLLAKCHHCSWTGCLWNALSQQSHPCSLGQILPEKESQEGSMEATNEAVSVKRPEEAAAMATALPQAAGIESQDEFEEKGSLVSEKGPLLDMVQTLLSQLRALQACLSEEAMSSSGMHLSSAAPETLCDAVDEFTVLLQDMEENFLAAEGSIVSGNDRSLPVTDDDADKAQQCESGQSASAKKPLDATDTDVVPHSGVTSPAANTQESEINSTCAEDDIHLQGLGDEVSPHEALPQHVVQSPEQSAAQKRLIREAERITHLAARAGQVSLLQQLLTATGIDLDHTRYADESLLYIACRFGYTEMAQMLISLGASVVLQSGNGRSPMHGAAYSGSLRCLELLLQKDADISVSDLSGDTPLHTAAQQGHAAFAEKLVHLSHTSVNKRNVCGQTPLHRASQDGNCKVIELLLRANATLDSVDDEGFTPLHIAVKSGNADAAKVLLDRKANPNIASTVFGLTPLHSAARQAEGLQLIQLLHAAGADVAACDQKGRSALHHAIKSNNLKVVQTVAEIGCPIDDVTEETLGSPTARAEMPYSLIQMTDQYEMVDQRGRLLPDEDDVQSGGATPLHLAILAQKIEFVRFLLSNGANVKKTTKTGCAAIHFAVRSGEGSLVKEIISAGSSTDLMTNNGLSPLHLAAQWGHMNAAIELINAGCDKEKLTVGKRKSKAMTALLIAAMKHKTEMVRTLAEAKCDVQATTADGHNAIHLAVSAALHTSQEPSDYYVHIRPRRYLAALQPHGYAHSIHHHTDREASETIAMLVQLGCDINAMDADELSPLDLARKGYHYSTFEEDLYSGWYPYHRQHYSSRLETTLRRLGAHTSYEMRQKATLSQTLHHATESAESIKWTLASKPKPVDVIMRRRQRLLSEVGTRVPSSYQLSHLVVPRVSRLWRDIGSSLDIAPGRLDEADEDCSGDSLECCMKVFNFWLHGEGKGPKTWDTVFDVLSEIGYTGLVESVKRQLQVY